MSEETKKFLVRAAVGIAAAAAILTLVLIVVFGSLAWYHSPRNPEKFYHRSGAAEIMQVLQLDELPPGVKFERAETIGNMFSRRWYFRFPATQEQIEYLIASNEAFLEAEEIAYDATRLIDYGGPTWFAHPIEKRGRYYFIPQKGKAYTAIVYIDEGRMIVSFVLQYS